MTLDELLAKMRRELSAAGVPTAALDARLLARQGGNFSDADLISGGQSPLAPEVIEKTLNLLSRRVAGEPVSRIAGEKEFWGLTFKVTPDTLDPRPDTETLVGAALKRAHEITSGEELGLAAMAGAAQGGAGALRILELGTGTGCVLISLLKELPHATGVGIDISPGAIAVSRENSSTHGVDNRVKFLCGSWFDPLEIAESGGGFDLIVSNPPYIPESEIESLAKEVRNHDPFTALSGGADGLDAYKTILKDLKNHLACGGFALFEIGAGQEEYLARLAEEAGMNRIESYADLAGIIRVVEMHMGKSENIFDSPC